MRLFVGEDLSESGDENVGARGGYDSEGKGVTVRGET